MYVICTIYSAIVKLPITGDWLFKEVKYSDFLQNRGKVLEQVLLSEKVLCSAEGVSQLGAGRAGGELLSVCLVPTRQPPSRCLLLPVLVFRNNLSLGTDFTEIKSTSLILMVFKIGISSFTWS